MYHVEDKNVQIWRQYVKTLKVPEPEMVGRTITTLRNDDPRLLKKCTSSSEEILHIEGQFDQIWLYLRINMGAYCCRAGEGVGVTILMRMTLAYCILEWRF